MPDNRIRTCGTMAKYAKKMKNTTREVAFSPKIVRSFNELLAEISATYPKRPALVKRGREVMTRAMRDSDAADKAYTAATKSAKALVAFTERMLALLKKGRKQKTAWRR